MNTLEQRGLVLRQLALLRRRGMPHDRALMLARGGLEAGSVRDSTERALVALRSGGGPPQAEPSPATAARRVQGEVAGPPRQASEPFDRLLASPDASAEQLEAAAMATEARLLADTVLRTARLHLSVLVALPLVAGSILAWWVPSGFDTFWSDYPPIATNTVQVLRFCGLPIALVGVVAARWAVGRYVVPRVHGHRAAGLVDDPDGDAFSALPGDALAWYSARRATVGAEQAGRELAQLLHRRDHESLALFRDLAPVIGAAVLLPLVVGVLALFTLLPMMGFSL